MSDMGDDFRAHRDFKRRLRNQYGIDCPMCREKLPKASPSILLPGQTCRIHNYRDPRPRLTNEQYYGH